MSKAYLNLEKQSRIKHPNQKGNAATERNPKNNGKGSS